MHMPHRPMNVTSSGVAFTLQHRNWNEWKCLLAAKSFPLCETCKAWCRRLDPNWVIQSMCRCCSAKKKKIKSSCVTATTIAKPPMAMCKREWNGVLLMRKSQTKGQPHACARVTRTVEIIYYATKLLWFCIQYKPLLNFDWCQFSSFFRWSDTMNKRRSLSALELKPTNKDLQNGFRQCHGTVRWHHWPLLLQRQTWLTVCAPLTLFSLRYWFGTMSWGEKKKLLLSSRSIIWTRYSI